MPESSEPEYYSSYYNDKGDLVVWLDRPHHTEVFLDEPILGAPVSINVLAYLLDRIASSEMLQYVDEHPLDYFGNSWNAVNTTPIDVAAVVTLALSDALSASR